MSLHLHPFLSHSSRQAFLLRQLLEDVFVLSISFPSDL